MWEKPQRDAHCPICANTLNEQTGDWQRIDLKEKKMDEPWKVRSGKFMCQLSNVADFTPELTDAVWFSPISQSALPVFAADGAMYLYSKGNLDAGISTSMLHPRDSVTGQLSGSGRTRDARSRPRVSFHSPNSGIEPTIRNFLSRPRPATFALTKHLMFSFCDVVILPSLMTEGLKIVSAKNVVDYNGDDIVLRRQTSLSSIIPPAPPRVIVRYSGSSTKLVPS